MRFVVIVTVGAFTSLALSAPAAADHVRSCEKKSTTGAMVCRINEHDRAQAQAPARPTNPAAGRPAPPPASDIVYWPEVVRDASGQFCLVVRREVSPNAANTARAAEAEGRMLSLFPRYPMCAGQSRPPSNPQGLARQVVRELGLPVPRPSIAPGFAITGKAAFLETGGSLSPPAFERPTELGMISVTVRGAYVVDWGDGSAKERFQVEGAPWPDGAIRHVYASTGRYDVVVTAEWTAIWQVAGASGATTGITTEGRLDGFEVRQLQAVRNR